jgi:hypothetical protein
LEFTKYNHKLIFPPRDLVLGTSPPINGHHHAPSSLASHLTYTMDTRNNTYLCTPKY